MSSKPDLFKDRLTQIESALMALQLQQSASANTQISPQFTIDDIPPLLMPPSAFRPHQISEVKTVRIHSRNTAFKK